MANIWKSAQVGLFVSVSRQSESAWKQQEDTFYHHRSLTNFTLLEAGKAVWIHGSSGPAGQSSWLLTSTENECSTNPCTSKTFLHIKPSIDEHTGISSAAFMFRQCLFISAARSSVEDGERNIFLSLFDRLFARPALMTAA